MEASAHPDVHAGLDGWLFLIGGSNQALRFYTVEDHFGAERVTQWVHLLQARAERARGLGSDYVHLLVPEKLAVYPEKYGAALPFADRAPNAMLNAALREADPALRRSFVNPLQAMIAQKGAGDALYWRTDSHWTFEGAYVAYEALCERLGAAPCAEICAVERELFDLTLDLGGKLNPPVREWFGHRWLNRFIERSAVNALVRFKEEAGRDNDAGLHRGSSVTFRSTMPTADPRRVVLFGDSFAEYREVLLTAMLAATFAETQFVWSSEVDWGLVGSFQPDILITETAERFMGTVPDDAFDLNAYVAERLAQVNQG